VIFKLYRFDPVSLLVFHLPTCAIKGSRIHFVLFFRLRWIIASQQMKPRSTESVVKRSEFLCLASLLHPDSGPRFGGTFEFYRLSPW
jgi:hypothetical protein